MSHRGDCFTTFAAADVWDEPVNLGADLLKPRLKTFFGAVDGKGGFLWRHDGQFGLCGHANLPRHPCGGR
ncbi:hypothetical protein D3C78_1948870 [compost metagenome]